MNRLRSDSSFWFGVNPSDGRRSRIVVADIAQGFYPQIVQRAKHAASDDVTLDFGELVLDLV